MKKVFHLAAVLVFATWAMASTVGVAHAQGTDKKIDPQQCEALQRQVDEIVAISESTTLTDKQKIAQLAKSLTGSLATMLNATRTDPDAAKIADEWSDTLRQLLAAAQASPTSDNKPVSPDAERGAKIVKNRIKPFIAVMQMLCPNLKVPDAVTR